MKIVLDTNVLVSALLNPSGTPARILDLVVDDKIKICVDDMIVVEYFSVISRETLKLDREKALSLISILVINSNKVRAKPSGIILPDPKDVMFIDTAVAARADAIVTGNKKHFPRRAPGGISVLSPSEFMGYYSSL